MSYLFIIIVIPTIFAICGIRKTEPEAKPLSLTFD